jgi:hypothetical protein
MAVGSRVRRHLAAALDVPGGPDLIGAATQATRPVVA